MVTQDRDFNEDGPARLFIVARSDAASHRGRIHFRGRFVLGSACGLGADHTFADHNHLNAFPSGHVAVSVAAAIAAGRVAPLAGVVLDVIAAGVAIGAATGRYHFVVDVAVGVAVSVIASAV
jgi:hypothetical protein